MTTIFKRVVQSLLSCIIVVLCLGANVRPEIGGGKPPIMGFPVYAIGGNQQAPKLPVSFGFAHPEIGGWEKPRPSLPQMSNGIDCEP